MLNNTITKISEILFAYEKGCATIVEMAAQPFSLVITIRTRY